IEGETMIAPPARVHNLAGEWVNERSVSPIALGGNPVQPSAIGIDDIQVTRPYATVLSIARPARRREDNSPIGQPGRISIIIGAQILWQTSLRQVEVLIGKCDLLQTAAVDIDRVD